MGSDEYLTQLELRVLSAVQKLGSEAVTPKLLIEMEKQARQRTSARTLYAVLSRLETRGLVTFQYVRRAVPIGSRLKVARLTPAGSDVLRAAVDGHARVSGLIRAILNGPNPPR